MPLGYLALILHAHLPFVRHPEKDEFLEERWLYEAVLESYIPLINVFERLEADRVPFRLTMSLTPPLISMLSDHLLQNRIQRHIERSLELAEKEVARTSYHHEFHQTAVMYRDLFSAARDTFYRYQRNLVHAFRHFQDRGYLEIITSGATHGYFPLIGLHRESIYAQVETAIRVHQKYLGRKPPGIWLPECAYNPGDEKVLDQYGLRYFILETHGLLNATPRPKYGVFAPVIIPGTRVAAFGRDVESSKQVWSSQEGYPGDYYYREFYRDIGHDLDFDYIKDYIHDGWLRVQTGIKYYRITGKTEDKQPYLPTVAREKAAEHAGNFMFNREKQVEYLARIFDRKPIVVAPYDAELFGHWWFEGPAFLEFLIRKIAYDQKTIELITPSDYLKMYPRNQGAYPTMSSWGWKGYNEVWLEGSNDWIYRHLHKAAERMIELAARFPHPTPLQRRALNQAARELLLAQSSDWAFIMKTGTMVEYAKKRTVNHIGRFTKIYFDLLHNTIDEGWLSDLEDKDNIFPEIDYRVYLPRQQDTAKAATI